MKPKSGTSKSAAADRRRAFALEYVRNGRNGTQAAITAGYAAKSAFVTASRLLNDAKVQAVISEALDRAEVVFGLSIDRTLREVARLAYFDPAKLYDSDGSLKKIADLDEDTRAAVASIEADITHSEDGEITVTKKIKFWDKNAALEKAMKHLGLYDRDNEQRRTQVLNAIIVPAKEIAGGTGADNNLAPDRPAGRISLSV